MANIDKILDGIIAVDECLKIMNKIENKDKYNREAVSKLIETRDVVRLGFLHFAILQEEFNRKATDCLGLDYPVELKDQFDRFMDRNRTFVGDIDID